MAVSVVMPALEMAQETGKLVSWLKQEGERVRKGEMLLEVETDKAVVEVEAAGDGILAAAAASPDDVVQVGNTIAGRVEPGDAWPAVTAVPDAAAGVRAGTAAAATAAPPVSAPSRGARISPKARRLAQEKGIDLATLTGSGPGGEILAADILAATLTPLTTIGRLMAERTTLSWTTIPHFFVTRDVDAGALGAARERMLPDIERSHGVKVTHTDLLVALVPRTLAQNPRLNAGWTADGIVSHEDVNVALAMAVDNAVVTAGIPPAGRAPAAALPIRRRDLAERARAGRLQPAHIAGATFTISNPGMFGGGAFTAIIVPPP